MKANKELKKAYENLKNAFGGNDVLFKEHLQKAFEEKEKNDEDADFISNSLLYDTTLSDTENDSLNVSELGNIEISGELNDSFESNTSNSCINITNAVIKENEIMPNVYTPPVEGKHGSVAFMVRNLSKGEQLNGGKQPVSLEKTHPEEIDYCSPVGKLGVYSPLFKTKGGESLNVREHTLKDILEGKKKSVLSDVTNLPIENNNNNFKA